jgi:BON domain-containing protein
MRDSEIEQRVLNQIKPTAGGRLREVCVFSLNGVVNLKGTVPSRADRFAAQKAAARAKGVARVINQLCVRRRNPIRQRARVKSRVVPVSNRFQFLQSSGIEEVRPSQTNRNGLMPWTVAQSDSSSLPCKN